MYDISFATYHDFRNKVLRVSQGIERWGRFFDDVLSMTYRSHEKWTRGWLFYDSSSIRFHENELSAKNSKFIQHVMIFEFRCRGIIAFHSWMHYLLHIANPIEGYIFKIHQTWKITWLKINFLVFFYHTK